MLILNHVSNLVHSFCLFVFSFQSLVRRQALETSLQPAGNLQLWDMMCNTQLVGERLLAVTR